MNLITQKNTNELTDPAKKDVALQKIIDRPKSIFLFTLAESTPAYTPRVEYEELNIRDAITP